MPLFDPATFSYDQLAKLNNQPGKSLSETNTPEQLAAAGSLKGTMTTPATPTPTAPATPTAPTVPSPTQSSPFALAQVMDALESKVKSNNTLMTQRNLLLKQLYDQPLTPEEKNQLDPTLRAAIDTGDRTRIDMSLRLISDEVGGRNSTLDQSVKFLTDSYTKEQDRIASQRQDAINNVLNFAQTYGSNAKSALTSLYGPTYVDQLKGMGIDLDKFSSLSTVAQQKANSSGIDSGPAPAITTTDFSSTLSPTQQATFSKLSSRDQSNVMQLVHGDALLSDLVTTRGAQGTAERQRLLQMAQAVDPTFSENANKLRYAFMKNWTSTESSVGKNRTAINTALGHLSELADAAKQLQPGTIQAMNSAKNVLSKNIGDPAVTNFRIVLNALAGELASVYKNGSAPTQQETDEWANALAANFTTGQFKGAFNTAAKLLSSKISAVRYQYKLTMGREFNQTVIDPEKRQMLLDAGIDPDAIFKENTGTSSAATPPSSLFFNSQFNPEAPSPTSLNSTSQSILDKYGIK